MADGMPIEWTHRPGTKGETWNPVAGCDIVSPGCTHCYAMRQARRIDLMEGAQGRATHYLGTTKVVNGKPVWTGRIVLASEHTWLKPLRWKEPRTIFVNSMSDLFHPAVPDEAIDRVFATAALTPQHTFIILTKRSDRMRNYVNGFGCDGARRFHVADAAGRMMQHGDSAHDEVANAAWPLQNVWLGVSAEDQRRADERIPDLLATPAAVRFVSAEPLLGPLDLGSIVRKALFAGKIAPIGDGTQPLSWVIVGGESGPDARPMHPEWARHIRDQCAAAGVPFFFKQWGRWTSVYDRAREDPDWRRCGTVERETPDGQWLNLAGGTGFHGEQLVRVKPVAKRVAGRLLDGIEHNAFPQVTS